MVARVRRRFAATGIIGRKEQGGAPPVDCKALLKSLLNVKYPVKYSWDPDESRVIFHLG